MNKDEVRLRYENWHTEMTAQEKDIFCLPWYQTVIKLLPDLNGMNVIEVGCGRGVFASYLANTYPKARITAIDFSENAIAVARSNYTTVSNLEFEVGDAEHLSHKFFDKFDFYISCETLEHVESPKKMIGEIQRVLKRDGRFILTTENYLNAYILIWLKCWLLKRPFDSGSGIQPNENFFLFPMIVAWLKKNQLSITHTESNHYQWLLLPAVSPSRLCTAEFKESFFKKLFKPFGRHFTYVGIKKK